MKDAKRPASPLLPVALFTCLIGFLLFCFTSLYNASFIAPDAAQYVSIAKNLAAGNGNATSILYYDDHYLIGAIPVPQWTFPPGYPWLIALVSKLGVDPQYSAFLVSVICFTLIPVVIYRILRLSGHAQLFSLILSIAWFCFPIIWFNVLGSLSETPFVLMTLISLTCVMQSEKETTRRNLWLFLAGVVAGLAYTVRYAGIFYITSLGVFFVLRCIRHRDKPSLRALLLVGGPPSLMVLALFLRNYSIAQSVTQGLQGLIGARTYENQSMLEVIHHFYWALSAIFGFSKSGLMAYGLPELLLVILSLSCVLLLSSSVIRLEINRSALRVIRADTHTSLSFIYVLLSAIFLAYLAKTDTSTDVSPRYLLPLIPFAFFSFPYMPLLVHSDSNSRCQKAVLSLLGGAAVAVFLAGQLNVLQYERDAVIRDNHYNKIQSALQQPFGSSTLFDFLRATVTIKTPLLANESQLLGVLLNRSVLAMPSTRYTSKQWTCDDIKRIAIRYSVSYVLFLPDLLDLSNRDANNQLCFRELLNGNMPHWLQPAFSSPRVHLYQVKVSALGPGREVRATASRITNLRPVTISHTQPLPRI